MWVKHHDRDCKDVAAEAVRSGGGGRLEARILGELDEAVALFKANPDYLHLLSTPSIPKRERCGLLDEALRDQVHLYV